MVHLKKKKKKKKKRGRWKIKIAIYHDAPWVFYLQYIYTESDKLLTYK